MSELKKRRWQLTDDTVVEAESEELVCRLDAAAAERQAKGRLVRAAPDLPEAVATSFRAFDLALFNLPPNSEAARAAARAVGLGRRALQRGQVADEGEPKYGGRDASS